MRFSQVDVFPASAGDGFRGNPLAVVHDADGLGDAQLARFASWTNLSETTFLLTPTDPTADYRVRIFTPLRELPFAGHPTLGSARAWLAAGGTPRGERVVQECGVGLVPVRDEGERLGFRAPGFVREGEPDADTLAAVRAGLGIGPDDVVAARWIDNGPGWLGLVLTDAATVLALRPDAAVLSDHKLGVLGAHPAGGPADVEVRAFFGDGSSVSEDPVTGSLNAGFGVWLTGTGHLPPSYVARQGTALGRDGRVHVAAVDGEVWVSGRSDVRITGEVEF